MREREILQISLGSPACEVTTHLLNLQGLAATSHGDFENENDTDVDPYCMAGVTHGAMNQLLVPRALLIDSPQRTFRRSRETPDLSNMPMAWSGQVENVSIHALAEEEEGATSRTAAAPLNDPILQAFQETASFLSQSQFSRYRVNNTRFNSTTASQQQSTYEASSSNSRHVNWDELEEEQEEQEEESAYERRQRLQQQRRQWKGGTLATLQNQLDTTWESILVEDSSSPASTTPENKSVNSFRPDDLLWTDYLAPPLHPRSILSLPTVLEDDAYFPVATGNSLSLWTEEEVFERMRNMLEDCDSCQGCVVSASGYGTFAGLATQILHYLQDECPSASRIVLNYEDKHSKPSAVSQLDSNSNPDGQTQEVDWRTRNVEMTRENVSRASAWSDYWESAHAVLPLQLPSKKYPSRFHSSAALATALEASTLPFRVRPNDRVRIGMNSYYYGSFSGDSNFGTVPNLSLAEFLGILKPREKVSVLELDFLGRDSREPLWPSLVEGTSVERDRRMRESPNLVGNRRPPDVLPGRWLLGPDEGGRLSSLSMTNPTDRALHTHYALSTAIRPSGVGIAPPHHYVDCLMQGMGIRFRPEQSAATILDQSLMSVTADGYGAGSYWRTLCKNQPVLAVVGNTTRFYPRANEIASNLKNALSSRSRGFYNRDVASGLLPEIEDCQEKLSNLWDLRDSYQPPEGSGLVEDSGGGDFQW